MTIKANKPQNTTIHLASAINAPFLCSGDHGSTGCYILLEFYPVMLNSELVDYINRICENCEMVLERSQKKEEVSS